MCQGRARREIWFVTAGRPSPYHSQTSTRTHTHTYTHTVYSSSIIHHGRKYMHRNSFWYISSCRKTAHYTRTHGNLSREAVVPLFSGTGTHALSLYLQQSPDILETLTHHMPRRHNLETPTTRAMFTTTSVASVFLHLTSVCSVMDACVRSWAHRGLGAPRQKHSDGLRDGWRVLLRAEH